ncbi:LacI family DNA-binding transcriptional regulator [Arthrobacter sp. Soc17.1.1.1]|uniref:LacI family DNA-binding transcriptional regulator n=1 Tax=Arthrobacter sp. Soc17.1.1.1 TaxID=3121277 RepID=UPI002FE466F2
MDDVAAVAGVSGATVSRVLNGTGGVSVSTKHRVEAALTSVGYHHNRVAGSLAGGRTMMIGVALPFQGFPASTVLGVVVRIAANHNYAVLVGESGNDPSSNLRTLNSFIERRVDGIIFAAEEVLVPPEPLVEKVPLIFLDPRRITGYLAQSNPTENRGTLSLHAARMGRQSAERLLQAIQRDPKPVL